MKQSFLVILVAAILPLQLSGQAGREVSSRITDITVFRSGAQVNRTGTVSLPVGEHTLLFANLPERLNPQSVQVQGRGAFTLLSVQHQVNYLKAQEKLPELVALEKKLNELKSKLAVEEGLLNVYQNEEAMILANKSIGGSQQGVDMTRLKEAADFFRTRLGEIQTRKIETGNRLKDLKEEIQKIENQINTTGSLRNKPTGEVLVNVSVPVATQGEFDLSYLVNEAGWYPSYDVRATDITKPIQLNYKANVYQTTGEDWKDVKLTLSTGNPSLGGVKPVMNPWYLDFYIARRDYYLEESISAKAVPATRQKSMAADEEMEAAMPPSAFTTVVEGQTNVEFSIGIRYSIPSDGKTKAVEIQSYTVPVSYEYQAVPKLDRDAFLLAKLTGWEEYNLMPGEINLFFEGTYVGKSVLDVNTASDTLNLSLGRDRGIVVTRTALRDYTKKQFLGSRKSETRSWEIEVRNNKKSSVKLVLQDQIPVSTNKEIEIECNEYSGGRLDQATGLIRWEMELKPAESRKLRLTYTVKYPKDRTVILE